MDSNRGEYALFDVGERLFLCSLKTVQKHPESILANCIKHSSSDTKGTTITLECDPHCFQWILDYMRDGQIDFFQSMSHHELRQLSKEAKFFGLDGLVKACEDRIADNTKGYKCIFPSIITSKLEFNEIIEKRKRSGQFTVLLNIDLLSRENIAELSKLTPQSGVELVSCHGKVTAYCSEFYDAGKLIKCSEEPADLLSYIYYTHTGLML